MRVEDVQSIFQLRQAARKRLPASVFNFIDGGAEDEFTMAENRRAFARHGLVPKVLRDVDKVDQTTLIMGRMSRAPLIIAPTGGANSSWHAADLAIARAAARFDIPYTLSTTGTTSIEEIADGAPGRHWFQLYVLRNEQFTDQLIKRAAAAGYEALVVAVDVPTAGKREGDSLRLPIKWNLKTILDFTTHPRWLMGAISHELPRFKNLDGLAAKNSSESVAHLVAKNLTGAFTWERLQKLRDRWPNKFIVKGVLHTEDAERLAALGIDGIWVSNHGGRQLDGAIATADATCAISRAVNGRVPLIMDSGVRRGSDVLKAIALGAQAVAFGRPTLYGTGAFGQAGAYRALEIFTEELERSMKLCGVRSISEINREIIRTSQSQPLSH